MMAGDRTSADLAGERVLMRWFGTVAACNDCDTVGSSNAAVTAHCAATGHMPNHPGRLLPLVLETFEQHPEFLRGRAIVYETDADLLAGAPGFHLWTSPIGSADQRTFAATKFQLAKTCSSLGISFRTILCSMTCIRKPEKRSMRCSLSEKWTPPTPAN